MSRRFQAERRNTFPVRHFPERDRVVGREFAKRAGLPDPEKKPFQNLGNRDLPAYRKKTEIQQAIRDHQISMVDGPTGSGKSTQIAQYALEMGYKKIVYLEPRTLLADNLQSQIAHELDTQLGEGAGRDLTGVRHSKRSTGHGKLIEIMTPGTFMRVMSELDEYEDEPVLIVGDEIHEKDFETELAVAASVMEIEKHPKWRLLLASATLDSEPIHKAYSKINNQPIPLVSIEGRPFELERIDEPDLTAVEALAKYVKPHRKAILFTAGKEEIRDYSGEIRKEGIPNLRVNPLHSRLSRQKIQQATHARLADGERQVIVSTNAGQSGITIPELTLVISDGMTRRPRLDEDETPSLVTDYCTQDELIQQAGRAGRDVGGGVAVYVKPSDSTFSYKSLEDRNPQSPAQIHSMNLASSVLLATATGKNFYELHARIINKIERPLRIQNAYEKLYRLGAIDDYNNITELGMLMSKFPVRPELSRALAEGVNRGASRETLQHLTAIASAVDAGGLPYFEKGKGENWRQDINDETDDDYFAQLNMFYATRQFYHGDFVDEPELEARNYDLQNTKRAHDTFDKICKTLNISSRDLWLEQPTAEQVDEIRDYLTAGLFDYAHRQVDSEDGSYGKEYIFVRSDDEPTRRKLSRRGTYKGDSDVVIGMPRGFETKRKGVREMNYVIENVMPTSLSKLTKYAIKLADRKRRDPIVVGGRLVFEDELWFGDILLGIEESRARLVHTAETKEKIREAAFKKPTQTVAELVAIKKELEWLVRIAPADKLGEYFPDGILTDEWLKNRIEDATNDTVDSIIAMDNNLRSMVSKKRISINTWVSAAAIEEIKKNSPEFIELDEGITYSLYYSHGKPVVNGFNLRDADLLPDGSWTLPDGREILINYRINSRDTKRHSAATVKEYAKSLD